MKLLQIAKYINHLAKGIISEKEFDELTKDINFDFKKEVKEPEIKKEVKEEIKEVEVEKEPTLDQKVRAKHLELQEANKNTPKIDKDTIRKMVVEKFDNRKGDK